MKRNENILMPLLLITFFSACIESDDITGVVDPPGQIQPEPEPTLVGFPIGIPTTKTVGANGGSISDASEVITVDIPAGALNQDTDITIQPVTNFAPNGNGNAYLLKPEGTVFNKPVKITFKHGKEISSTTPPLTGIAFQDKDGYWNSSGNFTWDEIGKTVSTETTHFSSWSTFDEFKIMDKTAVDITIDKYGNPVYQLNVEESGQFQLVAVEKYFSGPDGDELSPLSGGDEGISHLLTYKRNTKLGVVIKEWSVNGDVNGSTGVYGTINVNGQDSICTYVAPAQEPSSTFNPVQLSVKLRNLKYKDPRNGNVFNDLMVSTQLEIVGEFEWDFTIKYYSSDIFTGGLISTAFIMKDSASMKVVFKNDEFTFSDFTNSHGVIIPSSKIDAFGNKSTVQSESFLGPLHVTSATAIYSSSNHVKRVMMTLSGSNETPAFTVVIGGKSQLLPGQSAAFLLPGIEFTLSDDSAKSTWSDPGTGALSATLTLIE